MSQWKNTENTEAVFSKTLDLLTCHVQENTTK